MMRYTHTAILNMPRELVVEDCQKRSAFLGVRQSGYFHHDSPVPHGLVVTELLDVFTRSDRRVGVKRNKPPRKVQPTNCLVQKTSAITRTIHRHNSRADVPSRASPCPHLAATRVLACSPCMSTGGTCKNNYNGGGQYTQLAQWRTRAARRRRTCSALRPSRVS